MHMTYLMKIKKNTEFTKKEDLIKIYDQLSEAIDWFVKYSQYDAAIEIADYIYFILNELLERSYEGRTIATVSRKPSRKAKSRSKKSRHTMPKDPKRAICENFRDKQESAANGI